MYGDKKICTFLQYDLWDYVGYTLVYVFIITRHFKTQAVHGGVRSVTPSSIFQTVQLARSKSAVTRGGLPMGHQR